MSKMSDNAAKASSPVVHDLKCPHHSDTRDGLCYALTYAGKLCRYRAKITEAGYLPVCNTHDYSKSHGVYSNRKHAMQAGRCQAIEDCGQICNRLAKVAPPYHLCEKHQKGSDTLPCHLMRLPTELRLMIFRYLFPKVVPHSYRGVRVGILKTNRQINQEASSVL